MVDGNGAKGDKGAVSLPENWSELPEVKELISQSVKGVLDSATTGLKNKNSELLGEVKKFKDLAKQFEGIDDPEKAREAMKVLEDMEAKKLLDAGQIDKLFEQKTERMVNDHKNVLKSANTKIEELESALAIHKERLAVVTIEGGLTDALMKVEGGKVYQAAWNDIMLKGKSIWKLNEGGVPEARDLKTGAIIYGKDATTPITMKEWADSQVEESPYFFEAQGRGGSGGLPSNETKRKVMTLEDQLENAIKTKDLQLQIRLKRLIAAERANRK